MGDMRGESMSLDVSEVGVVWGDGPQKVHTEKHSAWWAVDRGRGLRWRAPGERHPREHSEGEDSGQAQRGGGQGRRRHLHVHGPSYRQHPQPLRPRAGAAPVECNCRDRKMFNLKRLSAKYPAAWCSLCTHLGAVGARMVLHLGRCIMSPSPTKRCSNIYSRSQSYRKR